MAAGGDEVSVEVVGVFEQQPDLLEEEPTAPVLILRGPGDRELHIPVTSCEGLAIHVALQQRVVARPLSHDLALRLLGKFSAELQRVVIDDFNEGAYYASLHLLATEREVSLAARPGDAVALAVRAEAPVYVTEDVFARVSDSRGDSP